MGQDLDLGQKSHYVLLCFSAELHSAVLWYIRTFSSWGEVSLNVLKLCSPLDEISNSQIASSI